MAADLIKEFADAGTYQILENDKFDPNSDFVLLQQDMATKQLKETRRYKFESLQKNTPKDCIDVDNKTITFTKDMTQAQFMLGIMFWASTKSNKRQLDGNPNTYEVNYAELVANLVWVKNKIGTIHTLNAGR